MNFCVIGGAGFLGRWIVRVLAKEGHEVVGLDIGAAPREDFGKGVRWARMDVTNFEEVVATFSASKPDVVFNLSFMRENVPRIAMKLNVLGMDNCLEAARLCNVKRVIYASSIAVNGRQTNYGDRPILETDPPAPRKQYDTHKVFNEWQAHEYRQKHGMTITCIRVTNVGGVDKVLGSVDHVECIVKPALGNGPSSRTATGCAASFMSTIWRRYSRASRSCRSRSTRCTIPAAKRSASGKSPIWSKRSCRTPISRLQMKMAEGNVRAPGCSITTGWKANSAFGTCLTSNELRR